MTGDDQRRKAAAFLALHNSPPILVLPNAWDVVSARLFQIEGFKAIGTTSAGIAATLGYPDGQRMSLTNNLAVVRRIAERIDLPISADIEAGYATSIDGVVQAARAALEAGAVGINLEDGTGFDRVVQWRKYYKTAECLEEQVIDGKTCYQIVMTPNNGEPETRYYDKQSGLLVKAKKTRLSSNMSPLSAELSFSDYRKVDGLLIAHKVKHESNMCGSKREMLFVTERVSHNVKLPPDRFDPPEEIRALAKKRASGGDTKQAQGGSGCSASGAAPQGTSEQGPRQPACGGGQQQAAEKQPQGSGSQQQEREEQQGCGKRP